jgi:hypothetical protein
MNDLRTNYATNEAGDVAAANAAWVARHTVGVTDNHGEYTETIVKALDPDQLRTVALPDLRRPDCRTIGDKYAELMREHVRVVDCLQAVYLRLDALEAQSPPCDYCGAVDYWSGVQHLAVQRLGALSAAGVAA